MVVGKQIELSKHLKELSLRNDQAINDMRKRYELEKVEIISAEKEKADKLIKEMENKCNEKIFANKRESERCLTHLKEEHGAVVARIQQDNELKESTLQAYHKEELQRIRSQAESELKERLSSLRQEHEAQLNSVNIQHEEDCQKLQDELELQKSKEEKQRALLQLQWKVMGENQQVDQEVNSKKRRDSYVRKESQVQLAGPETKRKVARIQQDNELKESTLRAYHREELQRIRSQAESELKERLSSLRQEHEAQLNSVNIHHEEDCQKLQDELELQKSKEEKQRALLQLQWKVMGENQQVDQEVNSKRRDSYVRKESQVQLAGPETKRKDVKLPGIIQSPISNALRKVTHHEYEVETANGRITKRRETTKSTVMFGEPNTQKSLRNTAEKDVTRTRKAVPGSHTILQTLVRAP